MCDACWPLRTFGCGSIDVSAGIKWLQTPESFVITTSMRTRVRDKYLFATSLKLFCRFFALSLSLPLTRSYHWHWQYFQEVFRCSVYKLCDSIINYSPFWEMKMTSIDSLVDVPIVSVGDAILPVDEQRQMETSGIFNRTGIL